MKEMKSLIIVRKDLIEKYGYPKMMVQAAHASTKIFTDLITKEKNNKYNINIDNDLYNWTQKLYKKIITYVKSEEKLLKIYKENKGNHNIVLIQDQGLTIYPKPTFTAIGLIGTNEEMNMISKKYKLQLLK